MGPQEPALRRGVDVLVATPGRLLDHMQHALHQARRPRGAGARRGRPHARHGLPAGHPADPRSSCPARRQTLLFSATMPGPIAALAKQILHDPVAIQIERPAAPAVGITHTVYPVPQELKSALLVELLKQRRARAACSSSRAPSTGPTGWPTTWPRHGVKADRIHGNRSQAQRTQALAGFKDGRFQVLVATDIAARGIDIDALQPRGELRRAGHARRLHPPGGPHRAGRGGGRRAHAGLAGRGGRPARHRAGGGLALHARAAWPASTTPSGRRTSWRSRWPSASRRSAPARPRIGSAPAPTPSGAPPTPPAPPSSPAAARRQRGQVLHSHIVGM